MIDTQLQLGEPIARLIRLHGGPDQKDVDYALLSYVTFHDMVVVHTQLEFNEIPPADLWSSLRQALIIRRSEVAGRISTIREQLQHLHEVQANEEQRHLHALTEEEEEVKEDLAKIEKTEMDLKLQDGFFLEDYELKKKQIYEEKEERQRESERRLKMLRFDYLDRLKVLDGEKNELSTELHNLQIFPLENRMKLWDRKSNQASLKVPLSEWNGLVPGVYSEIGLNSRSIRTFSLKKTSPTPTSSSPFTPKCPKCGATFVRPPPMWFCPICLAKKQSQRVWEMMESNVRCTVCCTAPVSRFTRHHCRNCGHLVCSVCCSNRAILPLRGFSGPEKVCDRCFESLEEG